MPNIHERLQRYLKVEEGRNFPYVILPAPVHVPYYDEYGHITTGYGCNLDDAAARKLLEQATGKSAAGLRSGKGFLTEDEADRILDLQIDRAEKDAANWVTGFAGLTEERKLVIIAAAFQLGLAKLQKFKNTLDAITAGQFDKAAEHMLASKWARQTPRRVARLAHAMKNNVFPKAAQIPASATSPAPLQPNPPITPQPASPQPEPTRRENPRQDPPGRSETRGQPGPKKDGGGSKREGPSVTGRRPN